MEAGRDLERIFKLVEKTDSCWLFKGAKTSGYGSVRFKGKSYLAHRAVYELLVGEIPQGKHLCHKCDVRNCVNPNHIFVGTQADNMKDCVLKGRFKPSRWKAYVTSCPSGHPYSGENLKLYKDGWRKCRICARKARMKNYYAKTR